MILLLFFFNISLFLTKKKKKALEVAQVRDRVLRGWKEIIPLRIEYWSNGIGEGNAEKSHLAGALEYKG